MPDKEKVVKGLQIERECVSRDCDRDCGKCDLAQDRDWLLSVYDDAIALLKEQEGYVSVPFSWLVKFCTHIDFVKPLTDAEREVAWRQKLRQQFGINVSKGGEVG